MQFKHYKVLARQVFPDLPADFENMPDDLKIYQLVFAFTCPPKPIDTRGWDFMSKHNLWSLQNMTETQIRNIKLVGHSCWNDK